MFTSDPSANVTWWYVLVAVIFIVALLKDHVVQDKIASIYNRIVKKYPF